MSTKVTVRHSAPAPTNISACNIKSGQYFLGTIDCYGKMLMLMAHGRILVKVSDPSITWDHPDFVIKDYVPVDSLTITIED